MKLEHRFPLTANAKPSLQGCSASYVKHSGWISIWSGKVHDFTLLHRSNGVFKNLREDWRTYDRQWSRQGLWVMVVYRFGNWRYTIKNRAIRMPFSFAYKLLKVLSEILTGIDLPCETKLGRRFRIDHFGGIVISGDAVFGDDCIVRNGVTVGLRHTGQRGSPVIGDRVDIGAGAKILGPIRIGDDVAIGANAVVITDVPPNSIAVGVPAKIHPRKPPNQKVPP